MQKGGNLLKKDLLVPIGAIHSKNSNRTLALLIGIVITALIGWISFQIQDVSFLTYLDSSKVVETIAILPAMFVVLLVHELIHVAFFHLFGKGKAKIEMKLDKEIGAIIMHQVNPNVYYRRNELLVILLAPLILLTAGLLLLDLVIILPFLIWINILLNAIGSSTDLYVSFRLLTQYKSHHLFNFDSTDHIINIYERSV